LKIQFFFPKASNGRTLNTNKKQKRVLVKNTTRFGELENEIYYEKVLSKNKNEKIME
jgi:hypothetical protein